MGFNLTQIINKFLNVQVQASNGQQITTSNRFPVDIGGATINATLQQMTANQFNPTQLTSGSAWVQTWVDTTAVSVGATSLSWMADQPVEVRLYASENQTNWSIIFAGFFPASYAGGSDDDFNVLMTPMFMPKSRYYRWVIYNRGTATTTTFQCTEKTSTSIQAIDEFGVAIVLSQSLAIRDTASHNLNDSILDVFGTKPKTIYLQSTLDQAVTINLNTARYNVGSANIGSLTLNANSSLILTYSNYPVLASVIHHLYGNIQASVAPTTGSISVWVAV